MLILSRHKNQVITIGDDIRIMVVEILDDRVKLGIDAPRNMSVHRAEVHESIKRAQEEGRPTKRTI